MWENGPLPIEFLVGGVMSKFARYLLIAGAAGSVLLLVVVGFVAATFNPNDYKPLIIKMVQEKKHRSLSIPGEIKLTFFPKIGADLGEIRLSERDSPDQFASVKSARVSMALWPLLSKHLVVERIVIDGASARLKRHKDASTNFDDLLSKDDKQESGDTIKFSVDSVHIAHSRLQFDDQQNNRQFEIAEFKLDTGQIASGGAPSKMTLSANIKGQRPNINITFSAYTEFSFDLEQKRVTLKDLQLGVNGTLIDYTDVQIKATGGADLQLRTAQFGFDQLTLEASARHAGQDLQAKLELPKLVIADEKIAGEKFKSALKLTEGTRTVSSQISAPLLEGSRQAFRIPELAIELAIADDQFTGKGQLSGSVSGDLDQQTLSAKLKGNLDQSQLDLKLGVNDFSRMALSFELVIDQIDADRYLSKSSDVAAPANATEKPLDLSSLKSLNAQGSLQVGSLKLANIKTTNLRVDLRAADGTLALSPIAANLYGGTLAGSIILNAAATPQIALRQKLTGVNVGPFLQDAIAKEPIDGKGNVQIDIATEGSLLSEMKKSLAGSAQFELNDGAIHGINLAQTLREAKAQLGAQQAGTSTATEKTDFTEFKARFKIANGVAHNNDLSAKSPLIRLAGSGDIDIARERIDYLAKVTVVSTLQGQGGPELQALKGLTVPVKLTGPLTAIDWKIDFSSMASDLAKQKIEEKKEQVKNKLKDQLKDQLKDKFKGLFGQ
jgi:AsmA protein